MIHINRGDGAHERLTDEQLRERYPGLHAKLNEPRPFNEGGEKLRRARISADMTVRELCWEIGLRPSELSAIEHGRQEATHEQIDAIGRAIQKRKENHQ